MGQMFIDSKVTSTRFLLCAMSALLFSKSCAALYQDVRSLPKHRSEQHQRDLRQLNSIAQPSGLGKWLPDVALRTQKPSHGLVSTVSF